LTDVVMPETNGRQLADALLADRPATRVLFMTGYSSDVLKPEGGHDGTLHLVTKPFSPQALLCRIRSLLDAEPSAP
jgi:DNA-binding response OmpR family regulator